jgi:hypothetical protein
MVLENASNDAPADFSDDAPANDNDPYAKGAQDGDDAIRIDISKLPRPVPMMGPLFGYTDGFVAKCISIRMQAAAGMMGRAPSEEEAAAIAYWTAKQVSVTSYGGPLGVAGGWWRVYTTKETLRFPFYKPNLEKLNAKVWPSARMALLSGLQATTAWHASRMVAYGLMGNIVGQVLVSSYALSVSSVGELTDPRLKGFIEAMKKKAQTARGRLPNQPPQPSTEAAVEQADAAGLWKGQRRDNVDDASPTASTYSDLSGTGAVHEQATRGQERGPRPDSDLSSEDNRTTAFQTNQATQESRAFDDDFDIISPTRKITPDTDSSGGPSGGSAWDRIRQQAGNQPAKSGSAWSKGQGQQKAPQSQSAWTRNRGPIPQEQPEDSAGRDGFGFSASEEDKQLARDEAQRQFDARVERERRGGDFSAGGDQKRW